MMSHLFVVQRALHIYCKTAVKFRAVQETIQRQTKEQTKAAQK